MGPGVLAQVLSNLPKFSDPNLLVGFDSSDDACVYRVNDDLALVQTVDFFPPLVDDPYLFGQIAAANALSDVYAMGATPTLAMNLLCYPSCLPLEDVQAILAGGASKVQEAGAILAGGHTIEDSEPKYGLCVSGFVHPSKILANNTAHSGDLLVLTKPIGTGVMTTAVKADLATPEQVRAATDSMATLNRVAGEAVDKIHAHACTDVTGFGLLGHAYEMAHGSGKTIRLFSGEIPLLPGVRELAEMGIIPAGAYNNSNYLAGKITFHETVPRYLRDLVADPQTSGGLFVSAPPDDARQLAAALPGARIVGEVIDAGAYAIVVE